MTTRAPSALLLQPFLPPVADLAIEAFRGSTAELCCFIQETWAQAYSGKMPFPVWSKEYFDWQLMPVEGQPDRRIAAYVKGELAAVLLGAPQTLQTPTAVLPGANYSWLSVAKKFRGQGLAAALDKARVALEREHQSDLIVSYRFTGSKHSLAEQPTSKSPLKDFNRRLGFWARPLDGTRLKKWNTDRLEGSFSWLLEKALPGIRWSESSTVRTFERRDLNDCLAVVMKQTAGSQLSIRWDEDSLERQLCGHPISQTVVATVDGHAKGFVNFHLLPFQARTRELVAVVDLICLQQLSMRQRVDLLKSSLSLMRDQGAILALKLRCGDTAALPMLGSGFIPRPKTSSLVLQWVSEAQRVPKRGPVHLLWR